MNWGPGFVQQLTLWLILHQADLTGNFSYFAGEKCELPRTIEKTSVMVVLRV